MITKENQIKFYTEELKEIEFSIKRTFNSSAISLFQNGELFVGQYKGFDEKRGNVFIDIPSGEKYASPRLDQKFDCFSLAAGKERPSNWGNITYSDLLKDRNRTEAKIVDFIPSKREGWITMLVRDLNLEFIKNVEYNQIVALGPTIPPFEYIQNLLKFSQNIVWEGDNIWEKIVSLKYKINKLKQPNLLKEDIDIPQLIIEEVDKSKLFILQGPPGTGKTHQVADIASRLVKKGYSVLITALTNKASVEVCAKPFVQELINLDKVVKLPLSIDERNLYPGLISADDLVAVKGQLTLTTYYQFSKIWESQEQSYDYVIVEEASQAFLTTIAAAAKVGKKVIVIGDPKQIVPIVTYQNYKAIPEIDLLINGMETLCTIEDFPYYRKIETRRLTERSTYFTNSFYDNTIVAKSLINNLELEINHLNFIKQYIDNKGGPSLIPFPKEKIKDNMIAFLIKAIDELSTNKANKIAVLTPYIETLTSLQQNLKQKTNSKNYLIESVDRVQGLDVDYCFYVVPKTSAFSFNSNRFNVATSRAKKATFILVEEDFDKLIILPNDVKSYIDKFYLDVNYIQNKIEVNNNDSNSQEINKNTIKILGKIDLSKFDKVKKEISTTKDNIYIIDTNVFVDCPEIIKKIDDKYKILLSAKVIDELDTLKIKLSNEQKVNVQKALKSINENISKKDIKMVTADLNLLPEDFNKKSPDNFILSVALKFKDENPIMLTSDNGLQIKSKGLGITTISLNDYLKQLK